MGCLCHHVFHGYQKEWRFLGGVPFASPCRCRSQATHIRGLAGRPVGKYCSSIDIIILVDIFLIQVFCYRFGVDRVCAGGLTFLLVSVGVGAAASTDARHEILKKL